MKRTARIVLTFVFTLSCLSPYSSGQVSMQGKIRKGNSIVFKENEFSVVDKTETTFAPDPQTNQMKVDEKVLRSYPIKINGREIYSGKLDRWPNVVSTKQELSHYISDKLNVSESLTRFGYDITIDMIVIDEDGKLVYYDYQPPHKVYNVGKGLPEQKIIDDMNVRVARLMNDPKLRLTPVKINGHNTPCLIRHCFGL